VSVGSLRSLLAWCCPWTIAFARWPKQRWVPASRLGLEPITLFRRSWPAAHERRVLPVLLWMVLPVLFFSLDPSFTACHLVAFDIRAQFAEYTARRRWGWCATTTYQPAPEPFYHQITIVSSILGVNTRTYVLKCDTSSWSQSCNCTLHSDNKWSRSLCTFRRLLLGTWKDVRYERVGYLEEGGHMLAGGGVSGSAETC